MNKEHKAVTLILFLLLSYLFFPAQSWGQVKEEDKKNPVKEEWITMDFNNVDLPVFIKFISEITKKNFVIDERIKGKVTIFSPTKISVDKAYQVFLSVMDLKGFTVMPAGDVIQIVPAGDVPPERNINVYYLENANAEEMAKALSGIVTRIVPSPAPSIRAPKEFEGTVQIIPDKPTNSLIIMASLKDYETLKTVIQKLDVKRRQVYVEAVIMEISLDKLREIGVELQAPLPTTATGEIAQELAVAGGTNFGGITSLATQGPVGLTGLAVGVVKGTFKFGDQTFLNVGALLRALQSDSDVNILSTPQLLTSDNQKAEIVVGQNVPFVAGQSLTPGGVVQTTIERKDVGITLRLTPQILENDMVKMDVFQEISTVTETPQAIGNLVVGPTTNKRSANTSIIVKDQQTVVLGGLIRDNVLKTERKVPILGDIPLLGWLFKFQSKKVEKTNLLIFITPYVVKETWELDTIMERKGEDMKEFLEKNKVENKEERQKLIPPTP